MPREIEYVPIDVKTLAESKSGLAMLFFDGDREVWIPKSVMEEWPDVGEEGEALVAEWFAEQEGLI